MYEQSKTPVRDTLDEARADETVDPLIAKLIVQAGRHLPGGSLGLRPGQALTVADVADALDHMIRLTRHWSGNAIAAETELRELQSDVDAFRRILGTTPEA